MSRIFLTVLDAVGAGEAPDAAEYGDAGANTLGHVIAACHPDLPNMAGMGLGNIKTTGYEWDGPVAGAWGRAREVSKGKDTTSGHWEIAGVRVTQAFPVFPDGFPESFMKAYEEAIGHNASATSLPPERRSSRSWANSTCGTIPPSSIPAGTACSRSPAMRSFFRLKSCMNSAGLHGRCCRESWASAG